MIKAIIFDFGGVVMQPGLMHFMRKRLEKSLGISEKELIPYLESAHDLLRKHKIKKKNTLWDLWKKGKINEQEFVNRFKKRFNVKLSNKKIISVMHGTNKADKRMFPIIDKLRKDYKVYALSNAAREWLLYERRKFGLDKHFDYVFTSYNLGMAKPNPKIYKVVLKKIKQKPENCVFIDNLRRNTAPAKLLGFKTIQFRSLSQFKKELKKFVK